MKSAAVAAGSLLLLGLTSGASAYCKQDSDCPSSYCQDDPTKSPPYTCHLCGDACCLTDTDCPTNSYCQNDDTHMPPYFCHGVPPVEAEKKQRAAITSMLATLVMKQQEAEPVDAHYPVYCKTNGYCHVPGLPESCTDDAQCKTPWYDSYCQSSGTCHLELPPKCKTDADCRPTAVSAGFAAAETARPAASLPFTVTKDPGAFSLDTIAVTTGTGTWSAGDLADITVTGKIHKNIVAGTVKYQVYQTGVRSFIASGSSSFFKCNNKGCDVTQPIALTLADGKGTAGTPYTLKFSLQIPSSSESPSKEYRIVFWSEDQDHYPYDFSATITYNLA